MKLGLLIFSSASDAQAARSISRANMSGSMRSFFIVSPHFT